MRLPTTPLLKPGWLSILAAALAVGPLAHANDDQPAPLPHRVFATSRFHIDEILARPYGPEVPFGATGGRLWASSPQGWAFADDVHWLYQTNFQAFDLAIQDSHGRIEPAGMTYYPSHVHVGHAARPATGLASASFTFRTDNVQNPLARPFRPEKRWTCWSSGNREDWYQVDLGSERRLAGLRVFFFDDAPAGGCRPPARFASWSSTTVNGGDPKPWTKIEATKRTPERPAPGENVEEFEPTSARLIRVTFRNEGEDHYTGLYGLEPIWAPDDPGPRPPPVVEVVADKFITPDDVLACVVRIHNPTDADQTVLVNPLLRGFNIYGALYRSRGLGEVGRGLPGKELLHLQAFGRRRLHDQDVEIPFRFTVARGEPAVVEEPSGGFGFEIASQLQSVGDNADKNKSTGEHVYVIKSGETKVFKAAMAFRTPRTQALRIDEVVKLLPIFAIRKEVRPRFPADLRDTLGDQMDRHQAWYDANLAYFDCSDPWVRKMYYHRAYNLRKNMMDPKLGRLNYPTQSEGRWRSDWYANVISYGAAHQVREARWLRDPSFAQGHLRTWADNAKADGVYPSHVRPSGPSGGQYTDWITSTAWDAHLTHPDRAFLADVVDKLAANVRGWQQTCDPDGDGLLRVDDHWWTGMEWQPSFFAFGGYESDPKDRNQPKTRVTLDRVDLTAYHFGNAAAVARIYRAIGQPEKAGEFEELAAKIAGAVRARMWSQDDRFCYSLRAGDGARADVKEIIGVYPFYFGMFPTGQGYESAWASILDPGQFWTKWPVASVSKQCPAYSQDGWPVGPGGSICMWNGPTWPHANSIVLSGMARTLRANRERPGGAAPLTAAKLWELFHSFTKAQYRDQDFTYPWTGEYYNGETAQWKTPERDYNHSTWLDLLIPDVVGLVPRDDNTLEVDPLLPDGALSHFVLDGQHYRGHDVTVAWDAPGGADHFGDGRKGLDIYLDGKLAASADRLARVLIDLATGERIGEVPAR